jgi:hypothetical protein
VTGIRVLRQPNAFAGTNQEEAPSILWNTKISRIEDAPREQQFIANLLK